MQTDIPAAARLFVLQPQQTLHAAPEAPAARLRDRDGREAGKTIARNDSYSVVEFLPLRDPGPGELDAMPRTPEILNGRKFAGHVRTILECGKAIAKAWTFGTELPFADEMRLDLGDGTEALLRGFHWGDSWDPANGIWLLHDGREIGIVIGDAKPHASVAKAVSNFALSDDGLTQRVVNRLAREAGRDECIRRLRYTLNAMQFLSRSASPYRQRLYAVGLRLQRAKRELSRVEQSDAANRGPSARDAAALYIRLDADSQSEVYSLMLARAAGAQ